MWIRSTLVFVLVLVLGSGASLAGEDVAGADAASDVMAKRLDVLRARIETQNGLAQTLRQAGRLDDAIKAYEEAKALYTSETTKIDKWLAALKPNGRFFVGGRVLRGFKFRGATGSGAKRETSRPAAGFTGRGAVGKTKDGSKVADDAVMNALRWLAAHQSPNGGWEAGGFGSWCDGKPVTDRSKQPDGNGKALYDVGVTGLALCAFLGAGYTNRGKHPFAKTISKGLRYLKNVQDVEGCFGPRATQQYVYNHATASLAMVEAYGMTGSPIFKGSAQRALDFIALARNPYAGWRYGIKPGDNDSSVTGWMLMALKSAKTTNDYAASQGKPAPLVIDESAFDGVRSWLDKVTDPATGRVGYLSRGTGSARPMELIDRFPAAKSEAMTAMGIVARIFTGEDPSKSQIIQRGSTLLMSHLPMWNTADGSIDMYYWHAGTLAAFQTGGLLWTSWNRHVHSQILSNQRKEGDACGYKGSWDPVGPWGPDGGRVYATALMAMCAQAHYRYARVFGSE